MNLVGVIRQLPLPLARVAVGRPYIQQQATPIKALVEVLDESAHGVLRLHVR